MSLVSLDLLLVVFDLVDADLSFDCESDPARGVGDSSSCVGLAVNSDEPSTGALPFSPSELFLDVDSDRLSLRVRAHSESFGGNSRSELS